MFGISRSSHVDFLEKSNIAFKHLFLKDWDPAYETMPYPPAMGEFAVYTIPDFYKMLDFALNQVLICILYGTHRTIKAELIQFILCLKNNTEFLLIQKY